MNVLACLIDTTDGNGYVCAWGIGDDRESAIASLREAAVGSHLNTYEGHTEITDEVFDRLLEPPDLSEEEVDEDDEDFEKLQVLSIDVTEGRSPFK